LGKNSSGDPGNASAFENTAKQMRTVGQKQYEERWSTPKKDRCFTDEEIKTSFESARANPIASISCSLPCVRGPIKQAKHQVEGLRTFPDRPEKLHRLRKRPTFIVQPCLAFRLAF